MYKVGQILEEHITYQDSLAVAVQEGFISMFMCYHPLLSPYINAEKFRKERTHFLMLFIDAVTGKIEAIR